MHIIVRLCRDLQMVWVGIEGTLLVSNGKPQTNFGENQTINRCQKTNFGENQTLIRCQPNFGVNQTLISCQPQTIILFVVK